MARETRVGLVVGLAFIICFAVILANRGRQRPPLTDVPSSSGKPVAGAAATTRPATLTMPGRSDRRSPASSAKMTSASRSVSPRSPDGAPANRPSEPAATDARRVSFKQSMTVGSVLSSGAAVLNDRAGMSVPRKDTSRRSVGSLTAATKEQQERKRQLQDYLAGRRIGDSSVDDADRGRSRKNPSAERKKPTPLNRERTRAVESKVPPSDAAPPITHTVASGDTLSAIAKARYGTRSERLIRAIFDANRSSLHDPNALKVGMVLKLPAIDGLRPSTDGQPAARPSKVSRQQQRSGPRELGQRPWRWYQIKKNDRYASIAREQLGDAGRWQEIYELNKGKFPDPNRIREGIRIKLPAGASASAGGTGR